MTYRVLARALWVPAAASIALSAALVALSRPGDVAVNPMIVSTAAESALQMDAAAAGGSALRGQPRVTTATITESKAVRSQAMQPEAARAAEGGAVRVEVIRRDDRWELLRNGEPYFIKGVGGKSQLGTLASLGGNSIRTWGHDELNPRVWPDGTRESVLDRAHRNGLTVTAGYWIGHERHGFDYSNEQAVQAQLDDAVAFVRRWKDHPAVLMWGVGNEVELAGDVDVAFRAINEVARAIKAEDPSRPTMTSIAGIWPDKAQRFMELCPDVDIVGINAYGGLIDVPAELDKQGMTKPYIVTEYGPRGHWESPSAPWGASIEQTSSEKAEHLREGYMAAIETRREQCLGGYAFVWGNKQERTATWYGLLLPTGERVAATDVLSRLWQGREPENRAPLVDSMAAEFALQEVAPGALLNARAALRDPDGDDLDMSWEVRVESSATSIGGDGEAVPPVVDGCIVESKGDAVIVRAPTEPGAYRLFFVARDGKGAAGTGNIPFYVSASAQVNESD